MVAFDEVLRLRFECADAATGEFRLQVMDPATWKQCGPYAMRFRSIEEAVAWMLAVASVGEDDIDVSEVVAGSVLLGTAPAERAKAIVSALQAAGALLLPGAPPWWVFELTTTDVLVEGDRARPEPPAIVSTTDDLDEERLGFEFHNGPAFGQGIMEFRYGSREPVLLSDARIEEWAQTGRGRTVVVYVDAVNREPFFVTLNADPTPEGDGFILSTDEFGDVKIRPFDVWDVSWLSKFPFGHDARSAEELVRAYGSFMRRNGRPYGAEADTPLEFVHAVTEPDGQIVTRLTYGFVPGDEDIPDIYFHPQLERGIGHWVPCAHSLTFDHEVCILEPYAAQAFVRLFDAGVMVPTSLARLGVMESGVEFALDSLPADTQQLVRAVQRVATSADINSFVNAGAVLPVQTLVSDVADGLAKMHTAGVNLEQVVGSREPAAPVPSVVRRDDVSATREQLIEFLAALLELAPGPVEVKVTPSAIDGPAVAIQLWWESDRHEPKTRTVSGWIEKIQQGHIRESLIAQDWDVMDDEDREHIVRFWEGDNASAGDIAECVVDTLWDIFGADAGDVYRFEPADLVDELLQGNFGPRFMLDAQTVGGTS